MANRLAKETSPYLQQHANNPVDWYPWGEEALAKAKKENKALLLSIGYSACHWCHVMERESFEDAETAEIMNQNFVSIKVDREERPDLDAIYMEAVQLLTGQGGWPLTVFLTPDGTPFYGGTYFPPDDRPGLPSFRRVLTSVADAYRGKRSEVERTARSLMESVGGKLDLSGRGLVDASILEAASVQLADSFDRINGGFGGPPKFPQPSGLEFLLSMHAQKGVGYALRMVEHTLLSMARGGIYDQLGGGFHRYAVDSRWLVPHFEKMLYDNAQLSLVYLHAYQITRNPLYRRIVEETLDYVIREMRHPQGGFYSSQDADSEGEEGKYYVWTRREILQILGEVEGPLFCKVYGASEAGNFEDGNILWMPTEPEAAASSLGIPAQVLRGRLDETRRRLLEVREKRVKPGRDEKILASWNGLMMRSFAEAARVLKREDYRSVAEANARFVLGSMYVSGRLAHSWGEGRASRVGFLEDYAFLCDGLLSVYQTTFDPRWFEKTQELTATLTGLFDDKEAGGFYDTPNDHETLYTRPKTVFDYSTPSGGSVAARVLLLLYGYTGEGRQRETAERALRSIASLLERQPSSLCSWLAALSLYLSPPVEVALAGDPKSEGLRRLLSVIFEAYRPNAAIALQHPGSDHSTLIPLLKGKAPINDEATAYVCKNFVCEFPTRDPQELARQLGT